jgi:RsmE family RNA methyltransferase
MLRKDAELLVDCGPSGGAVFAVGPEGDWTPSECETLSGKGFTAVSLGTRIMKSPTAVAVGLGFLSMSQERIDEKQN